MTQNFVANWLHINVIDIDAIDLHIDYLPSRITHQLFIDYTYTWCRLVNSVLNLSDGQVIFWGKIHIKEEL